MVKAEPHIINSCKIILIITIIHNYYGLLYCNLSVFCLHVHAHTLLPLVFTQYFLSISHKQNRIPKLKFVKLKYIE